LGSLEARAQSLPNDIPTQLALAEAYVQAGRPSDAVPRYQAVITRDPNNVSALDGLALILVASGSNDGAITAADRVLALRPRDSDALFVKGLALYNKKDWNGAVDLWTVYLDVGEFHSASDMVRALYADAKVKAGRCGLAVHACRHLHLASRAITDALRGGVRLVVNAPDCGSGYV